MKAIIIDDEKRARVTLQLLLAEYCPQIEIIAQCENLPEGVKAIRKHNPDLVLLDIEMPRMDGFEVATQMRHHSVLKDVPIIMITSRTGDKHKERAMAIGVNEYLGKPFQEEILLNTIKSVTGKNQ